MTETKEEIPIEKSTKLMIQKLCKNILNLKEIKIKSVVYSSLESPTTYLDSATD